MQGNFMDMFEEMDDLFVRLFSRMDREFLDGFPQHYRDRTGVRDSGDGPENQEIPDGVFSGSPLKRELLAEAHCIGNEVNVIADLPGISEEELRLDVKGDLLIIDAGDADNHYYASVTLPPVEKASMKKTLKNGVLEVTFLNVPDPSETV